MAQYQDGSPAGVGDQVAGKPAFYNTDVVGIIVGVNDKAEMNATIAFIETVSPEVYRKMHRLAERPELVLAIRPYDIQPTSFLSVRLERIVTNHFAKIAAPANTVVIQKRKEGGTEEDVEDEKTVTFGHRVTGKDLLEAIGCPSTYFMYRQSGGGATDPEIGYDQTVEVRDGMIFYAIPKKRP